jgi:hypothetical protein
MNQPVVTVKLLGGLGNQLFAYAAAKALSLRNGCPLLLDAFSGYRRDAFGRRFELGVFQLPDPVEPPHQPYGHRVAERMVRELNDRLPVEQRRYLFEKVCPKTFKHRYHSWLGEFRVRRNAYLHGNFTSPRYFDGHADAIRQALRWRQPPTDPALTALAAQLADERAVVVHFRLDQPENRFSNLKNLRPDYYEAAFREISRRLLRPRWFCFTDAPERLDGFMVLPHNATVVNVSNSTDALWLMRQGRNFVLSNSTFSWWGAWLSAADGDHVLVPPVYDYWDNLDIYPAGWRVVGER